MRALLSAPAAPQAPLPHGQPRLRSLGHPAVAHLHKPGVQVPGLAPTSQAAFCIKVFLFSCYLFLREREREREIKHEQGRVRERDGDTESEAGSRLRAVSTEPNVGLDLMSCEIMT